MPLIPINNIGHQENIKARVARLLTFIDVDIKLYRSDVWQLRYASALLYSNYLNVPGNCELTREQLEILAKSLRVVLQACLLNGLLKTSAHTHITQLLLLLTEITPLNTKDDGYYECPISLDNLEDGTVQHIFASTNGYYYSLQAFYVAVKVQLQQHKVLTLRHSISTSGNLFIPLPELVMCFDAMNQTNSSPEEKALITKFKKDILFVYQRLYHKGLWIDADDIRSRSAKIPMIFQRISHHHDYMICLVVASIWRIMPKLLNFRKMAKSINLDRYEQQSIEYHNASSDLWFSNNVVFPTIVVLWFANLLCMLYIGYRLASNFNLLPNLGFIRLSNDIYGLDYLREELKTLEQHFATEEDKSCQQLDKLATPSVSLFKTGQNKRERNLLKNYCKSRLFQLKQHSPQGQTAFDQEYGLFKYDKIDILNVANIAKCK